MRYKIIILLSFFIFITFSCKEEYNIYKNIISNPDSIYSLLSDTNKCHKHFYQYEREDIKGFSEKLKNYINNYFKDGYFIDRETRKCLCPDASTFEDFYAVILVSNNENKEIHIDLVKINSQWLIYHIYIGNPLEGW